MQRIFFYPLKNKNVQKNTQFISLGLTLSKNTQFIIYSYNIIEILIRYETKCRCVRCVLQDVVHRA